MILFCDTSSAIERDAREVCSNARRAQGCGSAPLRHGMPVQPVTVTVPRACDITDRTGVHDAASASSRTI